MKKRNIVFAIRIAKSFYVEDMLGAIIDEILYSDNSLFNPNMFPEIHEEPGMKVLFNRKTQNRFTINHGDFIFEYNIEDDFEKEYKSYLKSFVEIISKKVFKKYNIQNISRFGFVIKSEMSQNDELLSKISSLITESCQGADANSISLRYNTVKKLPMKVGKITTQDFDNIIITYDKANIDSPLLFSVDYQKYFRPELPSIEDSIIKFKDFCDNSLKAFAERYER